MDCFMLQSPEEKAKREKTRSINKQIKKDNKKMSREIKILLLGTGDSGKSTFMKQMRIIHQKGFEDKDKKLYIRSITQNMFTSMQSMIEAMDFLKIDYFSHEIMECVQLIKRINADDATFDDSNVSALKKLWKFDGIQESYRQRRHYHLSDSTKYFFSRIDRVASPNYIPNNQDILRVRVQTTGVEEFDFPMAGYNINIRMVDVGGQRSERRKWLHVFDNVTSVMFLVALSDYDQILYEAVNVNRLEESQALFKVIIANKWLKNASFILFLNKKDLLEEKIKISDLADFFPEYEGPKKDAMAAREFILQLFKSCCDSEKTIYSHFTCATDTTNIRIVFAVVRETILDIYLKECGMLH